MEFLDCECKLLYEKKLNEWFEEKDRTKKFSDGDLEFVKTLQQKYRFKFNEVQEALEETYEDRFYLDGRFGFVYFTEPDFVLFSFTELNKTKTLYHLSLEEPNLKADDVKKSQNGGEEKNLIESARSAVGYQNVYLQDLITGSNYGSKILAYANGGAIFLIDLDKRIGKLVAKWPIDPAMLVQDCCSLIPYDSRIKAAVNGDYSLVAATGPSEEEGKPQIRVFNLNDKGCSVMTLNLSPGLRGSEIHMMSFNPYHSELLYVSLQANKSQYNSANKVTGSKGYKDENVNDNEDDDDDDDDDDLAFVLFDISTEEVLAEVFGVSLIPANSFYNMIGSVKFLKQGSIIITYKLFPVSNNRIVFLDAFRLEILGSVNVIGWSAVLGNHTLISSCQSEFAIFKCKNLDSSNELEYEVEVYKVPDCNISLKHFCRKVIIEKVNGDQIDSLSLPNVLKKYLKL